MWLEKTVYCTGLFLLIAACSSSNADVPGASGSNANAKGGKTGSETGAGGGSATTGGGDTGNAGGESGVETGEGGSGESTGSGGSSEQTGGASTGAGGSGQTGSGGASSSTGGTSGGSCVVQQFTSNPVPPILQFVIDKSTSMNTVIGSTNGQSKWVATRTALKTAYAAMPTDFAVGENFFPNATGGCVNTSGGVTPAPLAAAQLAALQAACDAIPTPTNIAGTPTHDAWREGLRRLQLILASPPAGYETSTGYIVLVTDGMPVRTLNCGQAAGDNTAVTEAQFNELITDVAATSADTGIQTFVIAVPGSEDTSQVPTDPSGSGLDYIPRSKLSELARAGLTATDGCSDTGTPYYCDFDMVNEPNFVDALVKALAAITTKVITCSYNVPAPPAGQFINPADVKVTYTTSGGEQREQTKASSSACADGQWYVVAEDAFGIPTQLQLCPTTCDAISADTGAQLSVSFGCIYQQ